MIEHPQLGCYKHHKHGQSWIFCPHGHALGRMKNLNKSFYPSSRDRPEKITDLFRCMKCDQHYQVTYDEKKVLESTKKWV